MFHISFSILSVEIFIATDNFMQVYTGFLYPNHFIILVRTVSYTYNCQYFINFRNNCFIKYLLCISNKVVPNVVLSVCVLKLCTFFNTSVEL